MIQGILTGVCPILCVNGRGVHWLEMVGDAFTVVNAERVQDVLPAVDPAGEVLAVRSPSGGDQVQDLEGRLFGREVPAVADRPPEPGVERLDGVGIGYEIWDATSAAF